MVKTFGKNFCMELPYCKPDLVREDAQLSRKRASKAASFCINSCVFPFGRRTPEMSVIPWLTWQTMTGNESFPKSCGGSMLKFSLTVRLNVFVWGVELWHGPLILLGISLQFRCILGHSQDRVHFKCQQALVEKNRFLW